MVSVEENKIIIIGGVEVPPGKDKLVKINIAKLPTGTLIDIPVHVFNSKNPGPTILIQAGLHGDEINGVETVRRMLQEQMFNINKGAIIAVPILNVFGFIHFSRDVPDGKDVNRSFPGSKKGSLASRIAYHYTNEILPQIDFGIDLHTGGAQRSNFPQIRYSNEDPNSKILADVFNAPFSFPARLISGSFRKAAFKMEKPIIVYEAGESMRFDNNAIEKGITGVIKILSYFNMISHENSSNDTIQLKERKWIRASKAGMFILKIDNGSKVKKGEVIGEITDTFAKASKNIKAPYDGYIICVNNQAVVNQGDALFHVGK